MCHVTNLEFCAGDLVASFGQSWITHATEPGVDPRHLSDYRVPVTKTGGGFFQTWTDAFDSYTSWSASWDANLNDLEHGYSVFAIAAMAFLKDQPGGDAAWKWVNTNGYQKALWSKNPQLAIISR